MMRARCFRRCLAHAVVAWAAWFATVVGSARAAEALTWAPAHFEEKPWTRWWWLGSAVDTTNLTRQLEAFAAAGFGGVEICPIYGIQGQAERHLDFLSPRWMEMLAHTTREARRLGLGVDLTTGTGWPFGGPEVTAEQASSGLVLKRHDLVSGARLDLRLDPANTVSVTAVSSTGEAVELKERIRDGRLDWTAPGDGWRVYVAGVKRAVQKVKRPAPGGAGSVLDPYSVGAMERYLEKFDRAFAGWDGVRPRAQFHDSFEYYGATWTPDFLTEFQRRRGYDLRRHWPALHGDGDAETVARVKSDYRETISDLHLDYMRRWGRWAHGRGERVRNQAHGAPANLVDLYAASDIPETEIFGSLAEGSVAMNKFSTSAAHLAGRRLASAEAFTWLDEHFHASLAEVKRAADYLFLCGVNHVVYHGVPYSPADAPWPGWQFYASVNFGPQGGLWSDLPALNGYIARVQSVLQAGRSDNDVLLYFPAHDIWHATNGLLQPFTVHNVRDWLGASPAMALAQRLGDQGYSYDHVSDAFLAGARVKDGRIQIGEASYRAVLVPKVRVMPVATLRALADLTQAGGKVVFQERLPDTVPGWGDWKSRHAALALERSRIAGQATMAALEGDGLTRALGFAGEPMADLGLRFVRRMVGKETVYFVVNETATDFDGWLPLRTRAKAVAVLDPVRPDRTGWARLRTTTDGTEARLQIGAGESLVLRASPERRSGPKWPVRSQAGDAVDLVGPWKVTFLEGGPILPGNFDVDRPAFWTAQADPETQRFAGTARYAVEFPWPTALADDWELDLGVVADSARVRVNGREVATLWSAPFRVEIGRWLQAGTNRLEIDVSNVAANRVRDLDVRKVPWKYFEDANVVGKDYKPLDASRWPVRDAGLSGPVQLKPVRFER